MTDMIPSIVKENEVTLFIDGNTKVINDGHMNYAKIREALAAGDSDRVLELIDVAASLNLFGEGKVTVENGLVMFNGKALHTVMTTRMIAMSREGFDVSHMVAFLNNLLDNPSYRAVNELYGFLEETDLPFTEDGCFIAYKLVRNDYTDHYTGTFDNSVGAVPEMDRNEVNDDKDQTCSAGLHFCSQKYLGQYYSHGRTMIVKVNPRDVVSIPSDYNNAKGRACKYEIIGEIEPKARDTIVQDHSFETSVFTDGETLMSFDDAAEALCGHTLNPKSALRKRVDRGTVELRETDFEHDFYDMVVVKDSQRTDGQVAPVISVEADDTVSMEEAAETFCGTAQDPASALKKRIARGSVVTKLVDGIARVLLK